MGGGEDSGADGAGFAGSGAREGGKRSDSLRLFYLVGQLAVDDAGLVHFKKHTVFFAHDDGIDEVADGTKGDEKQGDAEESLTEQDDIAHKMV